MLDPENDREKQVLDKLNMEKVLPRPYNADLIKELQQPMNMDEDDIFEVARRRGQRLSEMQELRTDGTGFYGS